MEGCPAAGDRPGEFPSRSTNHVCRSIQSNDKPCVLDEMGKDDSAPETNFENSIRHLDVELAKGEVIHPSVSAIHEMCDEGARNTGGAGELAGDESRCHRG